MASKEDQELQWALLGLGGLGALVGYGWWTSKGSVWYSGWVAAGGWEEIRPQLVLVAVGLALVCVLAVAAAWPLVRRKRERERYEQEIRSLLRAKDSKRQLVQLRGPKGDRRITVRYPAGWTPAESLQRRVTQRLERACGQDLHGEWGMKRVVFTAARPDVEVEPVEPSRDDRVSAVVTGALGASVERVTVVWDGDIPGEVTAWFTPGSAPSPARRKVVERNVGEAMPGGGRWVADWQPKKDRVVFRPRPELARFIPHPGKDAAVGGFRVAYGVAEDGTLQTWNPPSVPHILLAGRTGTGKTETIRALIVSLLWAEARPEIVGCDPKQVEMAQMRSWPGVSRVATEMGEMGELIGLVHAEMKRRYQIIEPFKERGEDPPTFRPIVLVVDEFVEYAEVLKDEKKGPKGDQPAPIAQCASIARLGRTAQVHMIIAAQRPDVTFIPGPMRSNTDHRISLGELDEQGSRMMWGTGGIGQRVGRDEHGEPLKGRATATGPDGPREVQVYAISARPELPSVEGLESFLDNQPRPSIRPGRSVPTMDRDAIEANLGARLAVEATVYVRDLQVGDRVKFEVGGEDWRPVTVESLGEDGDYVDVGWRDDDGETGVCSAEVDELLDRR